MEPGSWANPCWLNYSRISHCPTLNACRGTLSKSSSLTQVRSLSDSRVHYVVGDVGDASPSCRPQRFRRYWAQRSKIAPGTQQKRCGLRDLDFYIVRMSLGASPRGSVLSLTQRSLHRSLYRAKLHREPDFSPIIRSDHSAPQHPKPGRKARINLRIAEETFQNQAASGGQTDVRDCAPVGAECLQCILSDDCRRLGNRACSFWDL